MATHARLNRPDSTSYEISVATTLLFQCFADDDHRPITVTGITCHDRTSSVSAPRRFLMLESHPNTDDPFAGLTQIHVVLNWFEDLQARVPTGR